MDTNPMEGSTLMTVPYFFSNTLSPDSITLGYRASTYEFGGLGTQTLRSRWRKIEQSLVLESMKGNCIEVFSQREKEGIVRGKPLGARF